MRFVQALCRLCQLKKLVSTNKQIIPPFYGGMWKNIVENNGVSVFITLLKEHESNLEIMCQILTVLSNGLSVLESSNALVCTLCTDTN